MSEIRCCRCCLGDGVLVRRGLQGQGRVDAGVCVDLFERGRADDNLIKGSSPVLDLKNTHTHIDVLFDPH